MSRKNLIFTLAGMGAAILALILRWNSLGIPLIRDEGEYAYSAWLLLKGISPYLNSFLQKPPLIIYSYALPQLFGFTAPWAFRFLAYLFVSGATFLTGLIVKKEFGTRAGIYAMLLLTPMVLLPNLEQFTANTEMFLLLPLMTVCYIYVLKKENISFGSGFWAGFFGGIALLYKPTVAPILIFLFIVWLVEIYKKNPSFYNSIKVLGIYFLGAIVSAFLSLGYFWHQDHLHSLLNILQFDSYYATTVGGGFTATFSYLSNFFIHWWFLWILLGFFIYFHPRRWWFYIGLFLASLLSSFGSYYGHYYILMMPFFAIICASALNILEKKIITKYKISGRILDFIIPAFILIFLLWSLKGWLTLSPEQFASQKLSGNPFIEAMAVAKSIDNLTEPADKILVAGSEPEILYYAKRQSATRFVIFYPLMLPTPLAEGYQNEAIAEIKKTSPKLIILVNSQYSWLINKDSPPMLLDYLNTTLKNNYHLLQTIPSNIESEANYLIYGKNI